MTSSGNPNTTRRRVAGERTRLRSATPETVVEASSPRPATVAVKPTARATPHRFKAPMPQAPSDKPVAAPRRRPSWMVACLALLLAMAALVTSVVLWQAAEDRRTLAGNQTAAKSAAGAIVEKMLGYDYRSFDKHTTEVSALLTGSFKNEFVQAATTKVKPLAVQNQAVVLAKASMVAVMSTPDQESVRILAFVDQTTTSAKLERPQIDQNRVILTMSQVGGRWLVSKVEAF